MKHVLALVMVCSLGITGHSSVIPPQKKSFFFSPYYKDYGSMVGLYKGLNTTLLQSGNDAEIRSNLLPFNTQIVNYVALHYGEKLTDYFAIDDPMIFFSGSIVASYEQIQATYDPQSKTTPQQIMNCMVDVIGVAKGIKELIASYEALLNGSATWGTLFSVVKNVMRRYGAWFMVGYFVYQFGDCIGWW